MVPKDRKDNLDIVFHFHDRHSVVCIPRHGKSMEPVRTVTQSPHNENQFAIFDYSIDQDLTQYLVVINTDENGNLDYMTMES